MTNNLVVKEYVFRIKQYTQNCYIYQVLLLLQRTIIIITLSITITYTAVDW